MFKQLAACRPARMVSHKSVRVVQQLIAGRARMTGCRCQPIRCFSNSRCLTCADGPPVQFDAAVLARMVDDARRPGVRGRPSNTSASATSARDAGFPFNFTLRRSVLRIAANAANRDRQKGRQSDVNHSDLLDMIMGQGGLCAYSGLPMELTQPYSHWQMSIERIDNSQGYVRGNYCLIAAEFNSSVHGEDSGRGTSQWSKRKVELINSLRH